MNLSCYFPVNQLSYGICGLNLLLALDKIANVSYFPIGQPQINTKREHAEIVQKCLKNAELFDCNAPSIKLWHQNQLHDSIGKGARFGFPIFELNKFNEIELNHLRSLDVILVCTEWAKQIIEDNKIDIPTYKVPLGVDRDIFKPIDIEEKRDVTRLLAVGKTELRKGHDLLFEYFSSAFEKTDNVELWVSWHNPFLSENEQKEWQDLYKNSKLGDKIRFVPFQQQPQQLNLVYNSVDCLISLSRAEGWNLPLLEGLSCGRQIIATNYSGHTEFLDKENSNLIDIDDLETAYDGKWFFGQGEWAVLADGQRDQCIEYMRKIHKEKQEGKNLFNEEGVKTAQLFNWDYSAECVINAINDFEQLKNERIVQVTD